MIISWYQFSNKKIKIIVVMIKIKQLERTNMCYLLIYGLYMVNDMLISGCWLIDWILNNGW